MKTSVNILGTVYKILEGSPEEYEQLDDCDGYCDRSERRIYVRKFKKEKNSLADLDWYSRKVLRHEIIHAFIFESGMAECSFSPAAWAFNEEMVDWFALQGPKIIDAWKESGCLDEIIGDKNESNSNS